MNIDLGPKKTDKVDLGGSKGLGIDLGPKGSSIDLKNVSAPNVDLGPKQSIPKENRFPDEDSFLEKALGALDYAGNISRSTIKGLKEGNALDALVESAKKERYTSPEQLRKTFGIGNIGKDDNKLDAGDFADFGMDLATDMVTDPLNWLTLGTSRLLKTAKTGADLAKKTAMAKDIGAPLLGAVYGAGVADKDDSIGERLVKAGAGAVGATLGKEAIIPWAKTKLYDRENGLFTKLSNAYGRKFGGAKNLSETFRIARNEVPEASAKYSNAIAQGKYEITDKLNPLEAHFVRKNQVELEDFVIKERREIFKKKYKQYKKASVEAAFTKKNYTPGLNDLIEAHKNSDARIAGRAVSNYAKGKRKEMLKHVADDANYMFDPDELVKDPKAMALFNEATREANDKARQKFLDMQNDMDINVFNAIKDWDEDNKKIVKMYNEVTGSQLEGLAFHTPKIFEKESADLGDLFKPPEIASHKSAFKTSLERRSHPLGYDKPQIEKLVNSTITHHNLDDELEGLARTNLKQSYKDLSPDLKKTIDKQFKDQKMAIHMYAEKESFKFLDQEKRQAIKDLSDYLEKQEKHPLGWLLKRFDNTQSFVKSNLLFGSLTWMKTNYWDNMAKAYTSNGIFHSIDSASLKAFRRDVQKDLWDIQAGKVSRAFSEPTQEYIKYGVLDKPMMKALNDDTYKAFHFSPEKLSEMSDQGKISKGFDKVISNWKMLQERTTGQVGSYFEAAARATSFDHNVSLLKKQMPGESEEVIKQMAAKIVKDTFFDYGNVTHFENAVMRRILPFYAFYKNNLPYWISAAFDPTKVGRMAQVGKFSNKIGDPFTSQEKEGLPDYMRLNSPRKLGEDSSGKHVAFMPQSSVLDAIKMANPATLPRQMLDMASPLIKTPFELLSGNDLFTDNKMYPSQNKDHKKHLFSRGHRIKYVQDMFDKVLGIQEAFNVYVDKNGNPITTNDFVAGIDKAMGSVIFPMPFYGMIGTVAGTAGKMSHGKQNLLETISDVTSPIKATTVSNRSYGSQLRKNKEEEKKERDLERKLEREKLLRQIRDRD